MKNLYHKVAVASVCTALGFALGANKEAKAATLTYEPNITFQIIDGGVYDHSFDGVGDLLFPWYFFAVLRGTEGEIAEFAEFNIGSFPFAPNTVVSSAVLQAVINPGNYWGLGVQGTKPSSVGVFGYVGNDEFDLSDFEAGVFLSSIDVSSSSAGDILNFDVTPFVNQLVSNGDAFAGFGIRALDFGSLGLEATTIDGYQPRLIVETADVAEPVPEPTTIFGSVLALSLGGWLKRKNSSQQNKTKSQG
jgi:hypothetical protein